MDEDQVVQAPPPEPEPPVKKKRRGNPLWVKKTPVAARAKEEYFAPKDPAPSAEPQKQPEPERPRQSSANEQVYRGRDGEILTRKRTAGVDIFDIPLHLIPKGWEYQWCAISVAGNSEILMDQNLGFAENGWRPVMADRYEGRFMPVGHKGAIVRGQQMLMERPKAMSDDARAEEERKARQQMKDRDQSLLGGKANVRGAMRDGFEMGGRYRGTGGDLRMSIDPAIDVPAPQHKLATDN